MTEIQSITPEPSYISIFVPMIIKKRGGRGSTTIITPHLGNKSSPLDKKLYDDKSSNNIPNDNQTNHDYRLIQALTKAYKLQQKMNKNPAETIGSLARKENLTRAYLGRLLRLNLLAPDIVEAILAGRQPKDLRLIDFMRKEIPIIWDEQKEKFGFGY
jgi:hypothetical protein